MVTQCTVKHYGHIFYTKLRWGAGGGRTVTASNTLESGEHLTFPKLRHLSKFEKAVEFLKPQASSYRNLRPKFDHHGTCQPVFPVPFNGREACRHRAKHGGPHTCRPSEAWRSARGGEGEQSWNDGDGECIGRPLSAPQKPPFRSAQEPRSSKGQEDGADSAQRETAACQRPPSATKEILGQKDEC